MGYHLQIVVDCADPHRLADWWAETLDWEVEPTDEAFIADMIRRGFASEDETLIHNGVRVWKVGAAICPRDEVGSTRRQRVLFQAVPEPKTVKNRMHWDVELSGADRDAVRAALEARGATYVHAGQQGPLSWYTMADPEGNEFCVV